MQAAAVLVDAHACDVCVIDVSQSCDWTEHLVLGTCTSRGQASAAAGAILYHVKQTHAEVRLVTFHHACTRKCRFAEFSAEKPVDEVYQLQVTHDVKPGIEGRAQDDWLLVDCGSTIVHIFTAEGRQTYDLESEGYETAPV
jgi:ribosomal silencing factor RsfS